MIIKSYSLLFMKKFIQAPGNKIGDSGAYAGNLLVFVIRVIMIFNHFLEHCLV